MRAGRDKPCPYSRRARTGINRNLTLGAAGACESGGAAGRAEGVSALARVAGEGFFERAQERRAFAAEGAVGGPPRGESLRACGDGPDGARVEAGEVGGAPRELGPGHGALVGEVPE